MYVRTHVNFIIFYLELDCSSLQLQPQPQHLHNHHLSREKKSPVDPPLLVLELVYTLDGWDGHAHLLIALRNEAQARMQHHQLRLSHVHLTGCHVTLCTVFT